MSMRLCRAVLRWGASAQCRKNSGLLVMPEQSFPVSCLSARLALFVLTGLFKHRCCMDTRHFSSATQHEEFGESSMLGAGDARRDSKVEVPSPRFSLVAAAGMEYWYHTPVVWLLLKLKR